MSCLALPVIVHRRNCYRREAALLCFLQYFNSRCIQAAMGEDQHDVSAAYRLILKKDGGVSFAAFEPEQALSAAGTDYVGPHEPHIHKWPKSRERAVSWKHILHWQDGMAAAEQMHQPAATNTVGHHGRRFLDVGSLCVPDPT